MPDSKYYLNPQSVPYKMGLEEKWAWQPKKLACKVKIESGNPAADELRARLREMAQRMATENSSDDLTSQNNNSKKAELIRKKKTSRLDSDEAVAATLAASGRAGIFNAPVLIAHVLAAPLDTTTMNLNKRLLRVPKSPPRKVMMDLQKERLIRTGTMHGARDGDHGGAGGSGSGGDIGQQLDLKLAEKQASRRRSIKEKEQNFQQTSNSPNGHSSRSPEGNHEVGNAANVLKPYQGDLFGSGSNNMGGMVYLSRMPNHKEPQFLQRQMTEKMDVDDNDGEEDFDDMATTESWEVLSKEREAQLNCAKTLCGW